MKTTILFCLHLILCGSLFAGDGSNSFDKGIYVKYGFNQTDLLRADDDHGETNRRGIAKNWRLSDSWILTTELNSTKKIAYLTDVIIEPHGTEVYNHDIYLDIGYFEMPVMINYNLKITNYIAIRPYVGGTLQLRLGDYTKVTSKEFICRENSSLYPCGEIEYDFSYNPDYIPWPRLIGGLVAGGSIAIYVFSIEYRYTIDSPGLDTAGDVYFNGENFMSTSIIFGLDVLNLIKQLNRKL